MRRVICGLCLSCGCFNTAQGRRVKKGENGLVPKRGNERWVKRQSMVYIGTSDNQAFLYFRHIQKKNITIINCMGCQWKSFLPNVVHSNTNMITLHRFFVCKVAVPLSPTLSRVHSTSNNTIHYLYTTPLPG